MVGLLEKAEGSDACAFVEDWLPKVLTDCFSTTPIIERAHRVGQINVNCPRPIVKKYLNYKDREKTLRAARKLKELRYRDQQVKPVPGPVSGHKSTPALLRWSKSPAEIHGHQVRILCPAHLILTHADKRRIFKTVSEVEEFIRGLKTTT
ncbi:LINE-1 type transposase domain-containing 1 [Labeo rohita]|uniref:LINE-1 type transposase domain-containing 1 n=1 Tax=Labeo rohita TaxID=84645 RepID=A0A498NWJ2_LABRO|nr:LINE-1 type transposase domain-containing 1 [Labeo rohita]